MEEKELHIAFSEMINQRMVHRKLGITATEAATFRHRANRAPEQLSESKMRELLTLAGYQKTTHEKWAKS